MKELEELVNHLIRQGDYDGLIATRKLSVAILEESANRMEQINKLEEQLRGLITALQ